MKQFNELTPKQLLRTKEFIFPADYTVTQAAEKLIAKLSTIKKYINKPPYKTEQSWYHDSQSYYMNQLVEEPFASIMITVHFANKRFLVDYDEDKLGCPVVVKVITEIAKEN